MLTFTALADPTRRCIVEMLAEGERTAGEIVARFDMTAPAISQHLKLLREAGLISVRADGQRRIHSLDRSGFAEMEAWIARTKRFWENRLDALEHTLRAEDEKKKRKKN
jgi:DNA-binding transcriptional ArsR family regulator